MAKETSSANASVPLYEVLEAEFVALHGELPKHYPNSAQPEVRLKAIWAAIHGLAEKRSALCFSGGGIRSATFGLGVLQGLARCGLLGKFHYLSTVSGGGYIGAWLSGWINRADGGLTSVMAQLGQPRDNSRPNPEPVEIQNLRSYSNGEVSAKMTFGEAVAIHLRNLDDNLSIRPSTRHYWRECLAALQKSWPGLSETEVRKITQTDCREWARAYRKTVSPTRYNNTVSVLRHALNVAMEAGVVYSNAAAAVERAPVRGKEIALPTIDQFNALIAEMRAGRSRDSMNCADFASGLAFTGCRVGEAREISWRDLDFNAGEIVVRGDAETGPKNWELRRVPLIPDARALFERMRSERAGEALDAKVFRVRECQKSLDRAAQKVRADRITHHDLRHLFATRCIESGVDIPTVSRWLGHKDRGALAMKTYGHLRREHSIAQAQRVSFAPVAAKQADVITFPATA